MTTQLDSDPNLGEFLYSIEQVLGYSPFREYLTALGKGIATIEDLTTVVEPQVGEIKEHTRQLDTLLFIQFLRNWNFLPKLTDPNPINDSNFYPIRTEAKIFGRLAIIAFYEYFNTLFGNTEIRLGFGGNERVPSNADFTLKIQEINVLRIESSVSYRRIEEKIAGIKPHYDSAQNLIPYSVVKIDGEHVGIFNNRLIVRAHYSLILDVINGLIPWAEIVPYNTQVSQLKHFFTFRDYCLGIKYSPLFDRNQLSKRFREIELILMERVSL